MNHELEGGNVAIPIGSPGLGIEKGPELAILGRMWVSMDELAAYLSCPPVRHEKAVDLPVKGGGTVKAHLFSVDGMLVKGMGAICVMGQHTAIEAESLAQRGLEESIQEWRDYQEISEPEASLTVIECGRETTHVIS